MKENKVPNGVTIKITSKDYEPRIKEGEAEIYLIKKNIFYYLWRYLYKIKFPLINPKLIIIKVNTDKLNPKCTIVKGRNYDFWGADFERCSQTYFTKIEVPNEYNPIK